MRNELADGNSILSLTTAMITSHVFVHGSETVRVGNGAEFTSVMVDRLTYSFRIELDFTWSGKPADVVFIETTMGRPGGTT